MELLRELDDDVETQPIKLIMLGQKDLLKRNDLYLKGGVFVVTYKQLVLDLLCKKVSPLIITGLIINQAHKCTPTCKETFLTAIIKEQNPNAFIKCFSDKPAMVKKGGLSKLEKLMRSLHTDRLILLPRINSVVRRSLDGG